MVLLSIRADCTRSLIAYNSTSHTNARQRFADTAAKNRPKKQLSVAGVNPRRFNWIGDRCIMAWAQDTFAGERYGLKPTLSSRQ
jgi:hypothetical protein